MPRSCREREEQSMFARIGVSDSRVQSGAKRYVGGGMIVSLRRVLLLAGCAFLALIEVFGAPLRFVPITLKQPDGSILNVYASGDEFYNWVHDKDNYTILLNPATGFYVYGEVSEGKLVPTEYVVGRVYPQSVGLKVAANVFPPIAIRMNRPMTSLSKTGNLAVFPEPFPRVVGSRFNLVIFVRFKGEPEFADSLSKYDNILNGVNGPSLRHFYRETSNNQLDVSSFIYPRGSTIVSYQDAQDRNYYRKYDANTNPTGYTNDSGEREEGLLKRALEFVKPQIPDDVNLDGNGDGFVDNVIFIVSGKVEAWADLLWPHAGVYQYWLQAYALEINGKKVGCYNFQFQGMSDYSVFDHEMGHTLGLPDLYRYTNADITPVGGWDLMASNSMHMNNYMKWKYLGWIDSLKEIKQNGTYWLKKSTSKTNSMYVIKSPRSAQEFFVLEYRSKEGVYEQNIPGSGLLVYRINNRTIGNAEGPPDEIYVYRPYGTLTIDGNIAGANFASDYSRTAINDSTNPSSFLSDGLPGGLYIRRIGSVGDSIQFDVEMLSNIADCSDYTVEKTTYDWIDISATATTITNWKNGLQFGTAELRDGYSASAIPLGFDFTYFGQKYASMYVGINGLVSFTHQFLNFFRWDTPTSSTQDGEYTSSVSWPGNPYFPNSMAVAYANFDLLRGGKVMYQTVSNRFVLSWLNAGTEGGTDTSNTFQLVLDNADGSIKSNFRSFSSVIRKQMKIGIQTDTAFGVGWLDSGDWADRIPANNTAIVFKPKSQYRISTISNPPGFGTTSGGGTYSFGQRTASTVIATPYEGFKFINWTEFGRVISTSKTFSFSSSASRTLVANFSVMPCLSLMYDSIDVSAGAGDCVISVHNSAADGIMKISAVSDVGWIAVTGGASNTIHGSGGCEVSASYQANTGPSRIGTLTIAADEAMDSPKVFRVRQAGLPLARMIPLLQQVSVDSLKRLDVLQDAPGGKSLQQSPYWHGSDVTGADTVTVTGVVVVKPGIVNNAFARDNIYVQDTTSGQLWAGLDIMTSDAGFTALDTGMVINISGRVTEKGIQNNSLTRMYYYSNEPGSPIYTTPLPISIGPTIARPAAREVALSELADGAFPKPSTGEKYESMYVVVRNITVISVASTGSFSFQDSLGNVGYMNDGSGWYTLSKYKFKSSSYTPPPVGTRLSYIRGVVVPQDRSGTCGDYAIMPLYPGPREQTNSNYPGDIGILPIVAPPSAPLLLSPSDSATGVELNPTLAWTPSAGPTSYWLQVSTNLSFGSMVFEDSTLRTTSRQIGPLLYNTVYYWRVSASNAGGKSAYSSPRQFSTIRTTAVEQLSNGIPTVYSLSQNYPNPFNPATIIQFALPNESRVSLKVFDLLGKEVTTLVSQELGPGNYMVRWQADVPSGTYIYRLQAGQFVETKKMILLH